jgi:O-antigen/teichoic acid export membrane protein
VIRRLFVLADRARGALALDAGRNLIRSGLTGFVATIGNRLLTIGSGILLARMLGADGYGTLSFALALGATLIVLTEFGMYNLIVRDVASAHRRDDWSAIRGMLAAARHWILIASLVVATTGAILIWLILDLSQVQRLTLSLMLVSIGLGALVRVKAATLSGLRLLSSAQLVELFVIPAIVFGTVAAVFLAAPQIMSPPLALAIQIVGTVIAVVFAMYRISALAPRISPPATPPVGFYRRAYPFALIVFAGLATSQLDTVIVGALFSPAETSFYRVGAQAAALTWIGIQIIQSISAPYFARLHSVGDTVRFARFFWLTSLLSALSVIPALVVLMIWSEQLIALTFGPEFIDAAPLLRIIAIGYAVNACCGPVGTIMTMTGRERITARVYLTIAVLAPLLMATAALAFGLTGVAVATAALIASGHLTLRVVLWRLLGI